MIFDISSGDSTHYLVEIPCSWLWAELANFLAKQVRKYVRVCWAVTKRSIRFLANFWLQEEAKDELVENVLKFLAIRYLKWREIVK